MRSDAVRGDPFDALGDPNRRAIVELLAAGPTLRPGARRCDAHQPAVSRHLRLLKDAGLVAEAPQGTRRIHRLREEGIDAVRAYLERVWAEAAGRDRLAAQNTGRSHDHVAAMEDVA